MPRIFVAFGALAIISAGCAVVGPASISNGRLAYAQVVNFTGDQELLNMIVRERYGETYGMLDVASITSNIKVSASVGAQFGFGPRSNYDGNLVPLETGAAYEENPTISYAPIDGETVLRQLTTSLSVAEAFLITRVAVELEVAQRELYRRVNGLRNPIGNAPSPDLERVFEIQRELLATGIFEFGRKPDSIETSPEYVLLIRGYGPEQHQLILEWLDLLEIAGVELDGRDHVIPVALAPQSRESNAINVETRSALDWIRQAAAQVEVPSQHLEKGIAAPESWSGPDEKRMMTVHSSRSRPDNAVVAVPFRGWWFYIDESDMRSKQSFKLLKFIVRFRLDTQRTEQRVPVLTVPVG